MRRLSILAILSLSVIAMFGCSRPVVVKCRQVESDRWRFSEFVQGVASWPYAMPELRRTVLLNGYKALKVGQSKDEVEHLIGQPDAEWFSTMYSDSGEIRTSSWGYYVHREEENLARPGDRVVFVEFTSEGTLLRANGNNLDLTPLEENPNQTNGR